ncbi:CYTH domain-containing protein [Polaribacter sp. MED152]|uniref:CYTH domain-containing protein n=1 Tax=Polaribacter sp. MED152 TaxID=313598 RepID=UPI000068C9C4|nr:CYTH domain-containing protein [Polaribacter sp. MED152]EAQ43145.1 adenylate cyclase family protein [Polaribacter sp. MED152]
MALEIERKFLVKNNDYKQQAYLTKKIKQGYLNTDKSRTVRVRIQDDKAFLTIKGKSNATGTTRFEWEKEIDKKEAEQLLLLCEPYIIDKTRFLIKNEHFTFEVDEFKGANNGLVLAEIELNSEQEKFLKPNWLGKEVTGDIRYYNSYISKKPFTSWKL